MVWLNFMIDITREFWGDFGISSLFCLALIAIFVFARDRFAKSLLGIYGLVMLIVIYNPLTYYICKLFMEETTFQQYYQRFFGLIPVAAIIAAAVIFLIKKTDLTGIKKFACLIIAGLLIVILGHPIYQEDWYTKAENRNKVPQDVVTICDLFADYEGDEIRIMAPQDIAVYLRQMDTRFSMAYARSLPKEAYELTNEIPDVEVVADYCKNHNIEYVVVSAIDSTLGGYLNYGFKLYGRTPYYAVLTPNDPNWILTEYGDESGLQGLCYTLHNRKDDTLIVFDGGHVENETILRDAIKEHGGQVDAWIITHFHKDHVDAFNEIYANPNGITIDQVYTTPMEPDFYHSIAKEWDDIESFDRFVEITKDANNINYVSRDDVLTFSDGLKVTFLNAFDEVVDSYREDIPNDGALVTRIETEDRSALLVSDCHTGHMAEYFVDTYGDKLDADILQPGHHGNNSMPIESGFYELVSPEVTIFDLPTDMLTSPQYTAGALAAFLQEMGSRIVWYNTAPNVFGL
ncbi:MAG: MBL fold metallo-hydrolase [Pseudobutyrivibrio sp.]|nr:MBL fold metallo-hydrolase [Pseudobutyrivibrio sp.]